MKLIIGLGNPEKVYDKTYHNIGFSFIDKLASKFDIEVKKRKCKSLVGEIIIDSNKREKVILVKPLTYMNLSGEAVLSLKNKYKVDVKDIYIISDDIDLPVGKYRYRERGSAGTHNGLKNIVQHLGSDEFKRIRIGIGKNEKMDLADYVTSKIPLEKSEEINSAIENSIKFLLEKINYS